MRSANAVFKRMNEKKRIFYFVLLAAGTVSMLTGYMSWKTMSSECIEAQMSPIDFSTALSLSDSYNIWTGLARANKIYSADADTSTQSK